MKLEKIAKKYISVNDLSEALNIPKWLAKFFLENSTIFWNNRKKKIDGVDHYGR